MLEKDKPSEPTLSGGHTIRFCGEAILFADEACFAEGILCVQVGQTVLVTEFLENGDLYKAINSQQGNRYHWYRMQTPDGRPLPNSGMGRRVALDIARGLHFLHTRKIVHFVSTFYWGNTRLHNLVYNAFLLLLFNATSIFSL